MKFFLCDFVKTIINCNLKKVNSYSNIPKMTVNLFFISKIDNENEYLTIKNHTMPP